MKSEIIYKMKSLLFDRTFFVLLFFSVFCFNGKAQAGDNDPTFNATDIGFGTGDGLNRYGAVNMTVLQSDGKITIYGRFTSYNQTQINGIARLNADGTLDDSFNPGKGIKGAYTPYGSYPSSIKAVVIQSDGKIIIGGEFSYYNETPVNNIARLNADGTLDVTFNSISGTDNLVNSISFQSDGKIIIGGQFNTYNGTTRRAIVRLNADGVLDLTFNSDMDVNSTVRSSSIQSDGKIIISGDFTCYNGTGRNRIARISNLIIDGLSTFHPKAVSIYPNPVSTELHIEIEGNNKSAKFEILNMNGQVVFEGRIIKETTIQTANFAQGIYLVKL